MRAVRVSEDIVPVSDFKAQAADWLKRIAETGQPLVMLPNSGQAVREKGHEHLRQILVRNL